MKKKVEQLANKLQSLLDDMVTVQEEAQEKLDGAENADRPNDERIAIWSQRVEQLDEAVSCVSDAVSALEDLE